MTREEFVRRWARGEPAMADDLYALLEAERAKAREEQREVDVANFEVTLTEAGEDPARVDVVARLMRLTPLTATPLDDRIAVLEKDRALSVQLCDVLGREVGKTGESEGAVQVAERVIRERDEARAKCAEWEEKAKAWMASPEAAARMSGYRSLADRIAELERERDEDREARRQLEANEAKLHEALRWGGAMPPNLPVATRATLEVVDRLRRAERERDEARAEAEQQRDGTASHERALINWLAESAEWQARALKAEEALAVQVRERQARVAAAVAALSEIIARQQAARVQGRWTDIERDHEAADEALLACVDDDEVRDQFDSVERWYA